MEWSAQTTRLIESAIAEDLGDAGDISSALLPDADAPVSAHVVPRQAGVICGLALAWPILAAFGRLLGATYRFEVVGSAAGMEDGADVAPGCAVALLHGKKSAVLAAERTLLNFLTRMSGVATLTRRYVEAARGGGRHAGIYDTRKTIPGWRELDKYAVRCGGGHNHRSGLYDAVLIKDNHLAGVPLGRLAATLLEMLSRVQAARRRPAFVEVEVDSLEQFAEICKVPGIDVVLLDNFTPDQMRAAVALRERLGVNESLKLEASGGVTLESVAAIAATGVDRIAIGALTHSAPALDIGLDCES